ncbi:MAG: SDR family oxidoreductase [Bacilli bacterium]|nr:SDR family oxidoreductase [Bacilli bacterium]
MYPIYNYIGETERCMKIPIAFPKEHQDVQPGLEYLMNPRPISENPDYIGSHKLEGKVAIITGGDSGIGRAVAYLFATEGADVVIPYLYEKEDAEETKQRIEQLGKNCLLIQTDLMDPRNCADVVKRAIETYGHLDVLVNNHGVGFPQKSIIDITDEQLEITFKTNILSYFYLIKAALPYLKENSSIINTASSTAYQGSSLLMDYSASKGAVVSLTRSLSLSLEEKKIRVNAVASGPTWTPLIVSSLSAEGVETFGTGTASVPMRRAGQPFEIATSYLFLASDDSRYMSGKVLHPDGGMIMNT